MRPHLTVALAATLAALTLTAPAHAFTLGVGDRADADPTVSARLGATTYRLVIDPAVPLSTYDERIARFRAAGMDPQLVVGGNGTRYHALTSGVVRAAVAAARRWPYAYSVSVFNEPDLSGIGVCEYARTYVQAYRSLRALGVKRIPFGEWSPDGALQWHAAALDGKRCPRTAPVLRRIVHRVAWHGYGTAIGFGERIREIHRQTGAVAPMLYITEAGSVLHNAEYVAQKTQRDADLAGLRYWREAMRMVRRDRISEVVAWEVTSPDPDANWDSSLVEPSGRPRPAFDFIAQSGRI